MSVIIEGYLTEEKLAKALSEVVGSRWGGTQLRVEGTKRRWDMWFVQGAGKVVVEFDGDEHYRNTLKLKVDQEKDAIASEHGLRVVRIPYWVQLDAVTSRHYFGIEADIRQDFPHGFIVTKVFPASYCEMGIERFKTELAGLPETVRAAVVKSLGERAKEHGLEYVLPSSLIGLISGISDSG